MNVCSSWEFVVELVRTSPVGFNQYRNFLQDAPLVTMEVHKEDHGGLEGEAPLHLTFPTAWCAWWSQYSGFARLGVGTAPVGVSVQ